MSQLPVPAPGGITSAQPQPEPVVHPDRSVTLRLQAPDARRVQVAPLGGDNGMGPGPYDLTRDDAGIWSLTLPPVRPGFHYYQLRLDGYACVNPFSEVCFGWGQLCSGLEVPDPEQPFVLPRDIPHGQVRLCSYPSALTGRTRRCVVYTPPSYESHSQQRYPVLHLQHGAGESERAWTWQGRAHVILDNLIADRLAAEMIAVMDNGYAARPGAANPGRPEAADNVIHEVFVQELVPWVDATFRTIAERRARAFAGLSMGAGQALTIGLQHPELFAAIGAMSGGGRNFNPATSFGGALQDPVTANRNLDLFWIGCGRQDGGFAGAQALHQYLSAAGIHHEWLETDGAHEWRVWRRHLFELAQKLFRPRATP